MQKPQHLQSLATGRGTGPDDKKTTLEGLVLVVRTYMNPTFLPSISARKLPATRVVS